MLKPRAPKPNPTEKASMLTQKARSNKEKPVKEPYTCLHDELIEAQLPLEITPVDIPDGKDEREMWEIFEKVFSKYLTSLSVYKLTTLY